MTFAKSALTSVLIAGLALAVAAPAAAQDKATLRLNWYLGGLHAPFYLGLQKGFYRDENIDLTINEGRGSVRSVQLVAAKDDTFGMADAGSLMLGASKGAPVRSVMSLLNTSGFGIIALEESNIRSVKDLEGKSLAVTAGDALTQLFPAVVAANKLDQNKIRLVQMDAAAKPVAVMEKKVDALLGGIDDQYFLIEAKGFKPTQLRFADLGVNTVGITILAHSDTLKSNPDLVRRFVKASQRAWDEARKDPGAAVDAALKEKPDLNRESTLKQLVVDIELLTSPNTQGKPIGWAAAPDWEQTMQLLKQYRGLETDQPATAFYTNEYLPTAQ